jgi:hypothetical protein
MRIVCNKATLRTKVSVPACTSNSYSLNCPTWLLVASSWDGCGFTVEGRVDFECRLLVYHVRIPDRRLNRGPVEYRTSGIEITVNEYFVISIQMFRGLRYSGIVPVVVFRRHHH